MGGLIGWSINIRNNMKLNNIFGKGLIAKFSLVLIFTVLFSAFMLGGVFGPREAQAAITALQNETNVYHDIAVPGATAASFAVGGTAGARMLVVYISAEASASGTYSYTSVTYGGVAMTYVNGDGLTSLSAHTLIFYLKDNAVMDGTAKTLAVNGSSFSGTSVMHNIWYAVYDGVDQSASPITNSQNYNSNVTVGSAQFATALTVNADDQAVLAGQAARPSSPGPVTYTTPANWTVDDNQPSGTTGVSFVARRSIPGSNTTDTANFTGITPTSRWSQTGMSMKAAVTTVGDGINPGNASLCPGDAATMLDSFTLQTSAGTDTVTAVQVSFAAGTSAGIGFVEITDDAGSTVYGSFTNPADTQNITLTSNITATTASTQYKVRITPGTHANMPVPPGASYAVTGRVTAITGTYVKTYSDVTSATVTIDNASPSNATWGTITAGDQQITLNWTNPVNGDFNKVLILRKTSSISDTPAEGTIYAASGTIGTSIVVYVGNGTTFTDTGLTNGTSYYYKVFAYDTCINYATGAQTGPHMPPGSPTLTYPSSPYDDGKNPDTGDTTTDFTFKVIYTDVENDSPAAGYPKIYIGDNDGYASYTMSLDTSAAALLQDGNYTNGEQYVYGPIGLGAAQDLRFYFEVQASTGNTSIVRLPSNAPTGFNAGPAVYLLYGNNMAGVPKDLGAGLSYSSVLGDDSGDLFCYTWDSAGLDVSFDVDFLGDWIDCTSDNLQTGKGYYIWATASNYWRLDEPSGTGNVAAANFDIDLDPDGGWNMISNPYNGIVQLQDVKVVRSSTEYTFSQAVTNGWIGNSIYAYEGPTTGYAFSAYNDTPPATLKPWGGYFIYMKDTTPTTLRVYKP